ncbi:MAG: UvrD-helicase domain-containing protein [Candidatus Niyogibacteria bacterium]|nr:UvrD-helicase domain-containing protein [Candidatus Niyogibacteria bacterium]
MSTPLGENLLSGLNDAQKAAVLHRSGPLLVVAGAGSGKTRVLTYRIAHLITSGVQPESILAITFTNKAAGEMKERVTRLLTGSPQGESLGIRKGLPLKDSPWIGTFHALGVWLLRREGKAIGIDPHFTIVDDEDRLALIKECVADLKLDPKQFEPRRVKSLISSKKTSLLTPDEHLAEAKDGFSRAFGEIWAAYEAKKARSHTLDFDDLLANIVVLFERRPDILEKYQGLWKFIHIDEYQDTDSVQYRIANLLARAHSNLCVVGDIDQAIYSFRGADFRNILQFEVDWPEATVVTLEENYRSTKPILDAANAVIAKNVFRKPKNLYTTYDGDVSKIELCVAENETQEAEWIAGKIKHLLGQGAHPTSLAVLFRTNAQSRALEEAFLLNQIPYHVVGVKFYARREIKDILAYLRAALNPADLISIKRIINTPKREIGKVLLAKYFARMPLSASEAQRIAGFEALLAHIREAAQAHPASFALDTLLKKTEYRGLFNPELEDDVMRLANIKELTGLVKRFDVLEPPKGVLALLEEAALMTGEESEHKKEASVPLTTVHAAKGLEFDHVFIAGLEDGLFPHTALSGEEEKLRLEEERRLFYVALTRAKKQVYLTLALFRTIFGERQVNMPSRFLDEIPPELIEKNQGLPLRAPEGEAFEPIIEL